MSRKSTRLLTIMALALVLTTLGCSGALEKLKQAIETRGREGLVEPFNRERSPRQVKQQLDNGLTVLVQENFAAPVVAVQIWVGVGSADETDREAGIAHVIEHLVFKGTKKRAVGQTAMEVESLGGDLNAFTSYDQTVFHITLASRFFDRALDILSDLVLEPTFDAGEMAKEKEVVLEEVRRGKDNPRSRIWKYLFADAYTVNPYRRPVIGYDETVSALTREDVLRFYHKYYVPSNMTVVVTGDVRAEDVIREVNRYLGKAPSEEAPPYAERPRAQKEPPQEGVRAQVYREDVSDGYFYLGFHVPAFKSEDMPALDVLGVILGGGETSRLVYRVRTERRLVNNIWAYSYTPRDPGMFMVGGDLLEEKSSQALEMITKQLYLLKHEEVEDWELAKAKLSLESDAIYSRETVDGQARQLGYYYQYTGNPDFQQVYQERLKAVTAEDLKRVANQYLTGRNLTAVFILPKAGEAKDGAFSAESVKKIVTDAGEWDRSYQPGSLAEPEPITPPEIPREEPTPEPAKDEPTAKAPVKFTLANGIILIVRENHSVPLVSVRAAFEGGVRRETPDDNGINNFIAETVTEGTVHYRSHEVHSMIESRAGSLSGFATQNSVGVKLEVPSAFFHSCLPLFSEVIRYPTFPKEEIERKRAIIISNIRNQLDQPQSLVMRLFRSELFHDHPYGLDLRGTEDSVDKLTREDLINYYQSYAVPGNLVIAVVGDVRAETVHQQMENLFKDWISDPYTPARVPEEARPTEPREISECKEVNQTNILVGFQGTTISNEDHYPLQVLSSVLSGMSGRLFITLRGKQSLAYSVYAFSQEGLDPGLFAVYIGTAPDKEEAARRGIMEQLKIIRDHPVSSEELNRAKEVLIGDFEINLQRYNTQAMYYATDELYGLGFRASEHYAEKISAVSAADVQRVAQKYLDLQAPVTAVVRPCEGQPVGLGSGETEIGMSLDQ